MLQKIAHSSLLVQNSPIFVVFAPVQANPAVYTLFQYYHAPDPVVIFLFRVIVVSKVCTNDSSYTLHHVDAMELVLQYIH